jgi:hypothetical protein
MSSMESAPATIPITSEATFNAALAPLSVGTLSWASASSRSPAERANASTGTSPAADTKFGSSNTAEVAPGVWQSCIYGMPFRWVKNLTLDKSNLPSR